MKILGFIFWLIITGSSFVGAVGMTIVIIDLVGSEALFGYIMAVSSAMTFIIGILQITNKYNDFFK